MAEQIRTLPEQVRGIPEHEIGAPAVRDAPEVDPDLALLQDRWPGLPEHIKAAIKALVQTDNGGRE